MLGHARSHVTFHIWWNVWDTSKCVLPFHYCKHMTNKWDHFRRLRKVQLNQSLANIEVRQIQTILSKTLIYGLQFNKLKLQKNYFEQWTIRAEHIFSLTSIFSLQKEQVLLPCYIWSWNPWSWSQVLFVLHTNNYIFSLTSIQFTMLKYVPGVDGMDMRRCQQFHLWKYFSVPMSCFQRLTLCNMSSVSAFFQYSFEY